MLDLIITGGRVVDGTGSPARRADVAVRSGAIVAVGSVDEPARRTVNADDLIVAPGFLDLHTHYDAQLFWDPALTPSSLHGVTTVMAGNCGFSIAPLDDASADFMMRMLARVEGMPIESLASGVPWNWRTADEYLAEADRRLAINAGFMMGHSALRRAVMGTAASERDATPSELATMVELLRDALRAGAIGFSSSTSTAHTDGDGQPVPSRWASTGELLSLAAVCGEFAGTSLELAPKLGAPSPDDLDLMARLSAAARRPLNWNVLRPTASNLEQCLASLEGYDRAAALGGKVVALTMPLTTPSRYNFRSEAVFAMIPGWEAVMALPVPERIAAFRDPAQRHRLEASSVSVKDRLPVTDWPRLRVHQVFEPALQHAVGQTVAELAAAAGTSPFDALVDLVCADDLRTVLTRDVVTSSSDWDVRRKILADPRTIIGGSDAGAHLDLSGHFNYPTRLLDEAVRREGLFTVEQLVHELTEVPARLYGLRDRGRLAEGAAADIVIFDEQHVGSDDLEMRFDLPASGGRMYAAARGIERVIVAGAEVVVNGELTGSAPGRVLRSGSHTATPSMI